jgi:hypothetical protein
MTSPFPRDQPFSRAKGLTLNEETARFHGNTSIPLRAPMVMVNAIQQSVRNSSKQDKCLNETKAGKNNSRYGKSKPVAKELRARSYPIF